jgi:pimeloyl-ACP methyl ester carboxylesterase
MKKIIFFLSIVAFLSNTIAAQATTPFSVRICGKGPAPIILIPGFGCSGDVWNETVESIGPKYTCYLLTMPGFAGVAEESNPEIKNWVKAIATYISSNHINHPVLIGHSLGGLIAEWIAADFPDLVSRIVVVDAMPCLMALSNPGFLAKQNPDCSALQTSFRSITPDAFYQMQKQGISSMVADTSKIEQIVQWSTHSDRNTLALIYCQLLNTDLRDSLRKARCPALILLEPSFKGISGAVSEQYVNYKQAIVNYAPAGLHFIMYDSPEWYLGQIKSFLD